MNNLKLFIEKNKFLASISRVIYRNTILKYRLYKQNKNFLQYSKETLLQINKVFEELEIQYWLEYGTLLGVVRDNNFIKHDLDIDLGLFLDDYSDDIKTVLEKHGFKKIRKISIDNDKYGLEESYSYQNVIIDLFYFTINKDTFYSHGFRNEDGKSWHKTIIDNGGLIVEEIIFPYNGFKMIDFLDTKYPIPKDAHNHLKSFYGENYMIKNTSWNPFIMAKNIKILDDKIGVMTNYE